MLKPRKGIVFFAFVISTLAVILSLVSLGTERWVVAKGELTLRGFENEQLSTIWYGLFSGTIFLFHTRTHYHITPTCIFTENACAYLCKATADSRELELRHLYNGQHVEFDMSCPQVARKNQVRSRIEGSKSQIRNEWTRTFLDATLYVSTVMSLSVSILFGVCSSVVLFWNTVSNPVAACLRICALYIYITIASITSLLAIVLWGIHFGTVIVYNVGILFTIQGQMDTRGLADLGYSYWLLLPVLLLHLTSILLLYIRQYLISEEESEMKIYESHENRETVDIMLS